MNLFYRSSRSSSSGGLKRHNARRDAKRVPYKFQKDRRAKFKSTEDLIHRLYVCISGAADQLQSNYAADFRYEKLVKSQQNIVYCVHSETVFFFLNFKKGVSYKTESMLFLFLGKSNIKFTVVHELVWGNSAYIPFHLFQEKLV